MKRIMLILGSLLVCLSLLEAAPRQASYEAYIKTWRAVAEQQEREYGIPASITLAQGLLESSAGESELAVQAHNHFGIKCTSDWLGDSYYYDDDTRGECFRVYGDAEESYRDHSLFLKRSRYQTLYELPIWDYKNWAKRLRECGYATDPLYAQKLIRIIEDYGLAPAEPEQSEDGSDPFSAENERRGSKAVLVERNDVIATIDKPYDEEEYHAPLSAREEKRQFYLSHRKQKTNGCKYVVAREGDTYANIAFRLNIRERSLRKYNDALGRELHVGERVYLVQKKKQAPKEKTQMWVHPGESLWEICQREGVKADAIRKYNGLDNRVTVFRTRQKIYMRKPPKEDK